MDLLKIIINPEISKNTCSLCYKHQQVIYNFYDTIEIHDEYLKTKITLSFILRELFPSHVFILPQACEDCTTLLLKIFIILNKFNIKNKLFHILIDKMNKTIDEKNFDKNSLEIDLPNYEDLVKCKGNTDKKSYKCKECSMKFSSNELLQKHTELCHKNANEAILCDICGKSVQKSSELRAHMNSHTPKQCPFCLKTFKSHSHHNIHVKNHTSETKRQRKKKYYHCNDCNYKSFNITDLKAHFNKAHLKIRPYKCGDCNKEFYRKGNLVEHLKTHRKFTNNICEVCGDGFVNKKTLNEHLRLHTGFKPYECTVCGVRFVNSGRRTEHMTRRHGEKNESCTVCGKVFSLKKDLKAHLKVHGVG